MSQRAAVVTVGSELVRGLRLDTNGQEVAFALAARGYDVIESVSVGDDEEVLAATLSRLLSSVPMVVVTGGLGPTHDDITREAAARALGAQLSSDEQLSEFLRGVARRHKEPDAAVSILRQAMVFEGAHVLRPTSGTAAGQVVRTAQGATLVLLPGPPHEMRPMLAEALGSETLTEPPAIVRCVGITESDAQVTAQRVLGDIEGLTLTVLATPSLVDVVLFDAGGGPEPLAEGRRRVVAALAEHVYAEGERRLSDVVLALARDAGVTLAFAESCTGGLASAVLTDIAGSSDVFLGGVVAYSDAVKTGVLGVSPRTLASHGAVSEQTASEMAQGARERLGADIAVSITGIAGPGGGTKEKPVGTVWFALAREQQTTAVMRVLPGDRDGVRTRAAIAALDMIRHALVARR